MIVSELIPSLAHVVTLTARCPSLSLSRTHSLTAYLLLLVGCQTLYAFPGAYRTQKTLIAAKYVGVDIAVPSFELGKDNKTPAFLAKNPAGKIPVLDTPTGPLFESNAIARYVARLRPDSGLYGASFYQQAQVDQWIDFSANELEPARGVWLYTVIGALPSNNPKPLQEAKKDVEAALKVLDSHFLHNTYLVGQGVTLADIAIFSALLDVYAKLLSPQSQKQYPNLLRWFNTIANQPEVSGVVGKVTFATAEGQPAPAAKGGKADKADKAGEKKEAAKKEDKPKPAPKPAADADDGDDDEDKPKEKARNPLDDLPPTSMQLDPIKKLAFSQRPILSDFFEQLWPQFDYSGYTWYTLHYKYNRREHGVLQDGQPRRRLHSAQRRSPQVQYGRAECVRQRGRGDGAVEGERRVDVPRAGHHTGDDRGEPGPGVLRVEEAGCVDRRGQGRRSRSSTSQRPSRDSRCSTGDTSSKQLRGRERE